MPDSVLRAMTDDSMFRVVAAETTSTTREIVALQRAKAPTAGHLADLVTSAVLFRVTMSPNLRVQWILRSPNGKGSIVADSHPSGATRGVVQLAAGAESVGLTLGSALQVMRTLPDGQLNQGLVELDGATSIDDAFMRYMKHSEQIDSVIAIGSHLEGDQLIRSGGFVVQLLPDLDKAHLAVMLERLRDFRELRQQLSDDRFSTSWLLSELLWGMPYAETGSSEVRAECWCSEVRVMGALATLNRDELTRLAHSSEVLEIDCEYCRHHYEISPKRLHGLLEQS